MLSKCAILDLYIGLHDPTEAAIARILKKGPGSRLLAVKGDALVLNFLLEIRIQYLACGWVQRVKSINSDLMS